ncbi:MAG: hypothetical protein AB1503_05155 [Bacillota bacterium]|nr:hypothetical protein [Bacillota bacterium]
MIPRWLRLVNVRSFRDHLIDLGEPDEKEVLIFGPNGSGKSTIARVLQAHCGDLGDDFHEQFLPEHLPVLNRRARSELTVLNPRDNFHFPEWPAEVVLGLEFGYRNNRPFTQFYLVSDGQRTNFASGEQYLAHLSHFAFKRHDQLMFVEQGRATGLLKLKPRQRYLEIKDLLGVNQLEDQWEEAIRNREQVERELRQAAIEQERAKEALALKEVLVQRLRRVRALEAEIGELRMRHRDEVVRRVAFLEEETRGRLRELEGRMAAWREEDAQLAERQAALEEGKAWAAEERRRYPQLVREQEEARRLANEERGLAEAEAERLAGEIRRIRAALGEGLTPEELQRRLEAARARAQELGQERERLHTERERLQGEAGEAERQLGAVQERCRRAREEGESAGRELQGLPALEEFERRQAALRPRLQAEEEACAALRADLQRAESALTALRERQVATPEEAIRVRDHYRAQGLAACVLGEVLRFPEPGTGPGLPLYLDPAEREAVEGALGPLRQAVVVEDGRVLVEYRHLLVDSFPDPGDLALPSVLSGVQITQDCPPCLVPLIERMLRAVVFAPDHATARAAVARTGHSGRTGRAAVAYTPDGFRYDMFGRTYARPEDFFIGPEAYRERLASLEETCRRLREELQVTEERCRALASELDGVNRSMSRRRQLEADLRRSREEEDSARALVGALERRVSSLREAIGMLADRTENLIREEEEVHREIERLTALWQEVARARELPDLERALQEAHWRVNRARDKAQTALELSRRYQAEQAWWERTGRCLESEARDVSHRREILRRDLCEAQQERDNVARAWELALAEAREALAAFAAAILPEAPRPPGAPQLPERFEAGIDVTAVCQEARRVLGELTPLSEPEIGLLLAEIERKETECRRLAEDVVPTAEEDYAAALDQFEAADRTLSEVQSAFLEATMREEEARRAFQGVLDSAFGRFNTRFSRYLEKFGFTGYLNLQHVGGTVFDLNVYVSVNPAVEPKPVKGRSGGEMAIIGALLLLSIVAEYQRPFYVFDEIDESLDAGNVIRLSNLLRQELGGKYFLISHRLTRSHLEAAHYALAVQKSQEQGSYTKAFRRLTHRPLG